MNAFPHNIVEFFQRNHVVSIATQSNTGKLWSTCCFYVFDEPNAQLIVLTSQTTQHGSNMAVQHHIAGTISGQPDSITKISGIQFQARAKCLTDEAERKAAAALFYQTHPAACAMKSDVWALQLDKVKFTDNKLVFAQKTHWTREGQYEPS
ncbi:pyridoxamine 5'-phosphate oxidase family protein [Neisseria yangbaofengii]|uniref:pyridoxamine 5'-phosphate oxidase family protein n=1 Tax=Neisseria yangbaofengii TaxID=2709396 RepID=UPI0013EC10E0|nr:pyridoxamine 5'-phosphate oxidase family protein [Neisseria yangbaofengii]